MSWVSAICWRRKASVHLRDCSGVDDDGHAEEQKLLEHDVELKEVNPRLVPA